MSEAIEGGPTSACGGRTGREQIHQANSLVRCSICGNVGHDKVACLSARKRPRTEEEEEALPSVCRSCGSSRHAEASCPLRMKSMECFQCHQKGHLLPMCPQTRCYNCGNYGHSSQRCLSRPLCYHCSSTGHRSTDCPLREKGRVCYRCKKPGHDMAGCSLSALCFTCNGEGHMSAQCPQISCNRCNAKGHVAAQCPQASGNRSNVKGNVVVACSKFPSVASGGSIPTVDWKRNFPTSAASGDENVVNDWSPDREEDGVDATPHAATVVSGRREIIPPFVASGAKRDGKVAVIVDGGYFERLLKGHEFRDEEQYKRCVEALRYVLDFIGEIFQKTSVAFWFDTDPSAFADYVENSMSLIHREKAFRGNSLRKRVLLDEMNGGRKLSNVVARLVGRMKRQKGYTGDGPGYVWVQTGVDVAIATCVIETFLRRQFDQVVLLCGDSDVYPAVSFCQEQRRTLQTADGPNPVRVCGTSSSISQLYGQDQDLCDFLPQILLDAPSHTEGNRTVDFPTHSVFQ